jgi:hypothetical protein
MNAWKPIALCLAVGLVASVGIQTASANKNPDPQPTLTGPCFDQPNMAAAKGYLESALGSLNKAEHNKNGWRVSAINATQTALNQTNTGCASANGR